MIIKKTIMVSGGFDPIHVGHVKMIESCAKHGDVIVALNSNQWLIDKKGYYFMKWEDRKYILSNIKGVKKVVPFDDRDGTACDALEKNSPDYFANGGDRYKKNTPELITCMKLGIEMKWFMGGGKIESSSDLIKRAIENENKFNK